MALKNRSYLYYSHKMRIAVKYLLAMAVVNLLLVLALVYEHSIKPEAKFYASSDVGEITLLNPIDKYKKSTL